MAALDAEAIARIIKSQAVPVTVWRTARQNDVASASVLVRLQSIAQEAADALGIFEPAARQAFLQSTGVF